MSNALVRGMAPAIQVAGALSTGIFFQNLGTSPVYLGYVGHTGPAVTSSACDGVVQAGGTYKVGAKTDVFLYSDVDTPVVWNYDADASADAGSQVVATGAVAISNKPSVAIPDGVVISGNVGILGNVGIAGNVNVQGGIYATAAQQYTSIFESTSLSIATSSSYGVLSTSIIDVSSYQSIIINWQSNTAANTAELASVLLRWQSISGIQMMEEIPLLYAQGYMYAIVPVKAPGVRIIVSNNGSANAMGGRLSIIGSTLALPEFYYGNPSSTFSAFTRTNITTAQTNGAPLSGDVTKIVATLSGSNAVGVFGIGAFARKATGIFTYNNSGAAGNDVEMSLQQAVIGWGPSTSFGNTGWTRLVDWVQTGAQASTLNFEIEFGKGPVVLVITGDASVASGQVCRVSCELVFQRF